jgi:hypothetical protein
MLLHCLCIDFGVKRVEGKSLRLFMAHCLLCALWSHALYEYTDTYK